MYALYVQHLERSAATQTAVSITQSSAPDVIETDTSTVTPAAQVPETDNTDRRPLDSVTEAGPAAEPIPFPRPRWGKGQRIRVRYFDPEERAFKHGWNVLISTLYNDNPNEVRCAYLPSKRKSKKTNLGYVQFCNVLRKQGNEFHLTDEIVVVKVSYWNRMARAEDPQKEVAAMQLIGNDLTNVLGMIDAMDIPKRSLNLVLPFCRDGDFFNAFKDEKCSEERARTLFGQVIQGLQQLHSVGVCHRDLSLENVMLDGNNCIVIDLGMSLRIPYSCRGAPLDVTDITEGSARRLITPQAPCGKPGYISPEIYRNRDPFDGEAIDVWSAGIIFYTMITGFGSYEWPDFTSDRLFVQMAQNLSALLRSWNSPVSDLAIDLMKGMLQVDPRLRLTTDEVLNHPWFGNNE
mmetsp:Transcript_28147/g.39601  ORF Transcript_28147/g.39601 Transcript_28147/m.39601 type:complete len:405 (+) Transcript_28147:23-1237(+)